jgi:leader peptidase (prepilin peptidase)/N-methyltransferase
MDLILFVSTYCFIFGAAIGSFLGVCAYRIPMGRYEPIHEGVRELPLPVSICKPARSFCPACQKQLLWWHNLPIISWFLLRGHCGFCGQQISFRYVFIEISTAVLCTLCYWRYGLTLTAATAFIFACALVVITFIDLDYMIIPDVITYPGTLLGILIAITNNVYSPATSHLFEAPFVSSISAALLGLAAGPGLLLSIYYFYLIVRKREGIGLGDVKLLAVIGAAFGMDGALSTIFVGSIIGAVVGVSLIALGRGKFSQYIPFGPYLAAAALLYIFDGQVILELFAGVEPSATWWIAQQ